MIIYSSKYYTKYNQIVKHYKELDLKKSKELYTESHHITPKSMGGTNKKDNLVRVPARVHFLLHWMLYRIYRTSEMAFAWNMMRSNTNNIKRYTSKSFEYAKSAVVNTMIGKSSPMKGKTLSLNTKSKISAANKGKTLSDETKYKISISRTGKTYNPLSSAHKTKISTKMKGKSVSLDTRIKLSNSCKGKMLSNEHKLRISYSLKGREAPNKGQMASLEARSKMSAAAKIRPSVLCPHCEKVGKGGAMIRYHFDNCKLVNK